MNNHFQIKTSESLIAYRAAFFVLCLIAVGGMAFAVGLAWAQESPKPRVIYPKKTKLDLDALSLEGEIKNPGEFYFQLRPDEKMDSLVKRRKNFHREMLRDSVLIK